MILKVKENGVFRFTDKVLSCTTSDKEFHIYYERECRNGKTEYLSLNIKGRETYLLNDNGKTLSVLSNELM